MPNNPALNALAIDRVPQQCPHGHEGTEYYEVGSSTIDVMVDFDNANWIEPGTAPYRNLMRRGIEVTQDLRPKRLDNEWFIVRVCFRCEADRNTAWRELHWTKSPHERRQRCARALAKLKVEKEVGIVTRLTLASYDAVIAVVRDHHLTRYDFKQLDERPQAYGFEIDGQTWHWKLRQVRNAATAALFEALEANETEGYTDDDAIPSMPLDFSIYT